MCGSGEFEARESVWIAAVQYLGERNKLYIFRTNVNSWRVHVFSDYSLALQQRSFEYAHPMMNAREMIASSTYFCFSRIFDTVLNITT